MDHEATAAAGEGGEINGIGGTLAKNHIGAAGVAAGSRIAQGSPHDQISEAITVHIPGTGNTPAAAVAGALAIDHEAAKASGDGGEVDGGG